MTRSLLAAIAVPILFLGAAILTPQVVCAASASDVGKSCSNDAGGTGTYKDTGGGNIQCVVTSDPVADLSQQPDAHTPDNPTDFKKDSDSVFNTVMIKIMSLFAWLVGVSALTLDNAVYYTVVTMGGYVHELAAVGVTWRILRDIGNILLIFGFLAIGISIILSTERVGFGKKMLPGLLIAAVFINFSLFITEAVIDAGNLFATQFYTQINGGNPASPSSLAGSNSIVDVARTAGSQGISNKIMAQLGLQTIYGDALGQNTQVFKGANPFLIGFLGILLFLTTAFVMFSLAFILIARFVALIFIIILAPVGFAGLAIPQLKSVAGKWWGALFEQTLTAPVLLLMLYVALAVITDKQFLPGFGLSGPGAAGAATGFVDGANLVAFGSFILSFIVAMGLLLAVTVFAKQLSAFGAGWATKGASMASFGATAWGARLVGGGVGRGLNSRLMRAQASKSGVLGLAAKTAVFTGRGIENRTYDVRNLKTVQGVLSGSVLGVSTGVAAGSSVTAGEAVKKAEEAAKKYKPFSGEWWRDTQKEYEKAASEREREKKLASPGTPDFKKELNKMSEEELAELKGIRQGLADFVHVLSPAKYDSLSKSSKLLAGEKDKLAKTWNSQFEIDPNTGVNNAVATIGRFSTEEVAGLKGAVLTKPNVVAALGVNEFEKIRSKGSLTKDERREIRNQMNAAAQANPTYAQEIADYFNPANDVGESRDKYWNV